MTTPHPHSPAVFATCGFSLEENKSPEHKVYGPYQDELEADANKDWVIMANSGKYTFVTTEVKKMRNVA